MVVQEPPTVKALQSELETLRQEFRREIESIREKLAMPTLAEEDEARSDARHARIDARRQEADKKQSPAGIVGEEIARQQRAAEQWLSACEIPADADDGLKRIALIFRDLADTGRKHVSKSALYAAGKRPGESCGLLEVKIVWPDLSPDQREELIQLAADWRR